MEQGFNYKGLQLRPRLNQETDMTKETNRNKERDDGKAR
jgi:hypothetical protein